KKSNEKKSISSSFLNSVETIGNKLPHPVTLFLIFCLIIIFLSAILELIGVSASGDILNRSTNVIETQTVFVKSILNSEGFAYMLQNTISNFTGFTPLGTVLVAMLGVGIAEYSGYITTLVKKVVEITPARYITPVVVFLGIMSNVAADVGYVILIPLGAIVFLSCGRHPIAGIAAAFAGVSGGFSANLIIGALDPLLSSISTEAAKIIDPNYVVQPTSNLYFMMVSTILITILGTIITNRVIEPRLGKFTSSENLEDSEFGKIADSEKKAMKYANITVILLIIAIVIMLIPANSWLKNAETGSLINNSPFMNGFSVIIALLFFIPSCVYGFVSGVFKKDSDIVDSLGKSMSSMGGYIVLVFVASQFVAYFNYTNMGTVLAISGAKLLKASGLSGPILMILFILLAAFINLFVGSASAKWAIMAPIFIPMFMSVGYSPELVQVSYRIGDSVTNLITPLMTYFPMIIIFAQKYDKKAGLGTITSTMLPYSTTFLIGWSLLLIVWMLLGLPVGVNSPLYL
ncbi:MAG: AbgT family transporter, partial [Anaerotignaceae bacterium]